MYQSQLSASNPASHLIAMGRISPGWCCVTLAVMVKGVKVGGRAILSMKVSRGNGWRHPLVVCKKRHQCFPAGFGIVTISPVSVHESAKTHFLSKLVHIWHFTLSSYCNNVQGSTINSFMGWSQVKVNAKSCVRKAIQHNAKMKQSWESLKELSYWDSRDQG